MFNLIPWKKSNTALAPDSELGRMRDEFDQLFQRLFAHFGSPLERSWDWDLGLTDEGKAYVIRTEAPGFEVEDFDVQIAGDRLTIKARRQLDEKKKNAYAERSLERTMTLPPGADPAQVEARYRNGVLELRLPKTPEAQGKRITVKS